MLTSKEVSGIVAGLVVIAALMMGFALIGMFVKACMIPQITLARLAYMLIGGVCMLLLAVQLHNK